jgi:hypothetical protein
MAYEVMFATQQPLPQLVTSHVNDCFSGPIRNFGNGYENKARYCEINTRDAFREPASPLSQ